MWPLLCSRSLEVTAEVIRWLFFTMAHPCPCHRSCEKEHIGAVTQQTKNAAMKQQLGMSSNISGSVLRA